MDETTLWDIEPNILCHFVIVIVNKLYIAFISYANWGITWPKSDKLTNFRQELSFEPLYIHFDIPPLWI